MKIYKQLVKKLSERTFFVWSPIHSPERYLIVDIEEAHFLGVFDKISPKSKISKSMIYLEEERDAKIFYNAYTRIFGKMHLGDLKMDGGGEFKLEDFADYSPEKAWEIVTEY